MMAGSPNAHDLDATAAQRLEALFRQHHQAVSAYARRRVSADAADDVVANTFVVAWRRLDDVPEDALPWLLAVARNVIATQRRGSMRRGALHARLQGAEPRGEAAAESGGHVAAALARLAERDREAITLIAWDGLRPAEAAAVLGQSAATFRVRLHRARRRLRRELDRGDVADRHAPTHLSPRRSQ
jgi:RNA polymerase sigma-70 factor (ECF subfamily)